MGLGRITEHFSSKEFMGDSWEMPTAFQIANGILLANNVLEPLRKAVGIIIVTSWFRDVKFNKHVGGADDSQHLDGKAVDIQTNDVSLDMAFAWIINNLNYDQCILEKDAKGRRWIHVSYNNGNNRREALKSSWNGKKMIYEVVERCKIS